MQFAGVFLASSWVYVVAAGPFPDTSDGVHLFTLWSPWAQDAAEIAEFDFVWSIQNQTDLKRYRDAGVNRSQPAVLSRYVPFGIAPSGDGTAEQGASNANFRNLTWWQEHHPSWVLYQCDRVTPATYWGPGIGLDITNPAVLEWQLHAPRAENSRSAASIAAGGYDAISLDVFSSGNWFRACGRWEENETPGGAAVWKAMYTNATDDATYAADVMAWLKAFYEGLQAVQAHSGRPLLLVPNYPSHKGSTVPGFWGTGAWNSTFMFDVGNHSDGILSEEGFTGYGQGLMWGDDWLNKHLFMRNLQQHGKAYFSINYQLKNNSALLPITVQLENYVVASFLVSKEQSAAMLLGSDDGFDKGRLTPAVGAPVEPGHELMPGLWRRGFKEAFALVNVNPPGGAAYNVTLDTGYEYTDHFTGQAVAPGKPFMMSPSSGAVLMRAKMPSEVLV